MPADEATRNGRDDQARPFVLGYAKRRPLEERRGRYDEAAEVWVVEDGTGEVPLVRSHAEALEETITRSPENTDPPRRPRKGGRSDATPPRAANRRILLDETVSSYRGDPTDPPRPRKDYKVGDGQGADLPNERLALDETITKVVADPTDVSRPRRDSVSRAGKPRPFPDETLTFTSESTDESRPRRSGF